MADFTSTGGAHRPGFTDGVGREVVVVQVQLFGVGMEIVHLLGIAGGAQRCGGEHLGESALKQTGTMHPARQDAGHGADLAHLVEAASIHTLAILEDLLTHQFLGQRLEAVAEQLRAAGQGLANGMVILETCDGLGHFALHCFQGCVPLVLALIKLAEDSADRFGALLLEIGRNCAVFFRLLRLHLGDAQILEQLFLSLDQFADRFVAEIDRLDHVLLGQLVGAGLDHHHAVGSTGDHQVQITPFDLPVTRVEDEVIPQQTHPHGCHRAVEGDARKQRGYRCARHRQNIGGDPLIEGQAGGYHL